MLIWIKISLQSPKVDNCKGLHHSIWILWCLFEEVIHMHNLQLNALQDYWLWHLIRGTRGRRSCLVLLCMWRAQLLWCIRDREQLQWAGRCWKSVKTGVAVQGPIANIPYIDIACYSHMSIPSLLAPLQDLPWVPCPFLALAWLFGRSQAAPCGDKNGIHSPALSTLQLLYWTSPRAPNTQYSEHWEPTARTVWIQSHGSQHNFFRFYLNFTWNF